MLHDDLMERLRYYYRIYHKAFGPYTPQVVLIVVLAFLSSAMEGLGVSAIVPAFSFVNGSGGSAATDTISRFIAGLFGFLHIAFTFKRLVIFIAVLFVTRVLLLFFIRITTARIIHGYERDLREALFTKTLVARWPFLSQQQIGNLEQLMSTNTTNTSQFFGNVSASVMVLAKVIMYIGIAVNISVWVAVFAFGAGVLVFFVLKPIFYRVRVVGYEAERTNRKIAHFVGEHVIGMKAIKAMALEEPVTAKGRSLFEKLRDNNYRSIILRSYIELAVQCGAVCFVGFVFVIMYRSGNFSLASFGIIVYAINQIFGQVQAAQLQLHTMGAMFPYMAELLSYMERTEHNTEERRGTGSFSLETAVSFDDVSFSYASRGAVLAQVSFQIPKGKLVGIIGPSGAGKTTVADLLLRLVDPTEGRITIDGHDIRELSIAEWRGHVGYVAQDAVLLNDTIESNIAFYGAGLSHEDIVAAAKHAYIHEFIQSLPDGYETVIGERGIMLSGGQRQRVALARVLARKPSLLVLDEATSSLDTESERAIQTAIENLRGEVTVVVIAHRMTTVANTDTIIVLQAGRVVESGTPAELLKHHESYFSKAMKTEPYHTKD